MDRLNVLSVDAWLTHRGATLKYGQPLWNFDYNQYRVLFRRCAEISGVAAVSPHPYSFRHGGAPQDALEQQRYLMAV